jgi:hypothetical protein
VTKSDRRDAHVLAELWRPALLDFYESIARLLDALAVPEQACFDAAGTLMNYVLSVAVQNAANARQRHGPSGFPGHRCRAMGVREPHPVPIRARGCVSTTIASDSSQAWTSS